MSETDEPVEIIRIIFTTEDIEDMADAHEIDRDVALARALEWGRHITDTMTGYCFEQLEDVIITGNP